jgi:UTP--glucose-1-phosphate uridylyltransferase
MAGVLVERVREEIGRLPAPLRRLLARHGFDLGEFLDLVRRWETGKLGPEASRVSGRVEPLAEEGIALLHAPGSAEHERCREAGLALIRDGKVGALVLNGGMGTRFGGVVKGSVQVLPGRTFLGLKLEQLAALPGTVPAFVMNSFATEPTIADHLAELRPAIPVHCFTQGIAVRLTPQGDVFHDDDDPLAALYAPGHGDAAAALRMSRLLRRFRESGGEWLVLSNVDNLGATVDPAVLGQVALSGKRLAVELAERYAGDLGGLPAVVDGVPQILEHFRFPGGFDTEPIRRFNTNTLAIHAAVLEEDRPLTWFAVRKSVGGSPVIQFERLIGELSAFEPTLFLGVPRQGPRSRFLPVKVPDDLEALRPEIRALVAGWAKPG